MPRPSCSGRPWRTTIVGSSIMVGIVSVAAAPPRLGRATGEQVSARVSKRQKCARYGPGKSSGWLTGDGGSLSRGDRSFSVWRGKLSREHHLARASSSRYEILEYWSHDERWQKLSTTRLWPERILRSTCWQRPPGCRPWAPLFGFSGSIISTLARAYTRDLCNAHCYKMEASTVMEPCRTVLASESFPLSRPQPLQLAWWVWAAWRGGARR